ncbi:CgeB family protein [Tellurirhabdus bombi]|uniref:CgeB family protein n=1 Tax=Tellurirhabdus bombi TaxID=2907205 RepID=UPI001F2BAB35|nr:glycosyltransferase [Tellurirhabdus bombi]
MKVLLVGYSANYSLEASYYRAFTKIGVITEYFNIYNHLQPYIKFGKVGSLFNQFIPVDIWQRKVNRELALYIKETKPDLVLVFCNAPVLYSTLAFVKSVCQTKFILIWPDPLTNLQAHVHQSAQLYDGVATYSKNSVPIFEKLGFLNVNWLPLAADPELHNISSIPQKKVNDLIFIGALRPEREETLAYIGNNFPNIKMIILGSDWHRNKSDVLKKSIQKRQVVGKEYSLMLNQSKINLNIIDNTCFPAANMRFFEIPISSGLQLASVCPEFDDEFQDELSVLYYNNKENLLSRIEWILTNSSTANNIIRESYQLVKNKHTYLERVNKLVSIWAS